MPRKSVGDPIIAAMTLITVISLVVVAVLNVVVYR